MNGILFKGEERLKRELTWWEKMTVKWYHYIYNNKKETWEPQIWDLREHIDEACKDSSIIYYFADLSLDELREFRDKLIWNETFWNKVKHREELKKDFHREFEECEEKYYDWDNEDRWPENQDMYGNEI